MNTNLSKKKKIFLLVDFLMIILLVLLDQFTKYLACEYLQDKPAFKIIDGILELNFLKNSGAAFGIGVDHRVVLLVLTVFALICAVWLLLFSEIKFSSKVALAFVVGGGLGNLVDRMFRGFVVDYIDLRFLHFAVFNFADICVSLGSAVLIFLILKPQKSKI